LKTSKTLSLIALGLSILVAGADLMADSSDAKELILRAELLLKIGARDHGAGRALEKSEALLLEAKSALAQDDITPSERIELERQYEAVSEDLEIVTELNDERFFGAFPLVRLTIPDLTGDEGLILTEQLFHAPDVAATMRAAAGTNKSLGAYHNPQVVWISKPPDRRLENLAAEVLRGGHAWSHSRRSLVAALNAQQLEMIDSGAVTPELIDHLRQEFGAVSLTVLTIKRLVAIEDGAAVSISGDVYTPGEVVQGSPLEATLSLRVESFSNVGYAFDRRSQFLPALMTELLLLLFALVWASRVKWRIGAPLKVTYRLAIGGLFYLYGRLFMILAVWLMHRYIPEQTALIISAIWWPSIMGLMAILLVGLVAWLGQARLTNVVAGARGARAVGSIFSLASLGAGSYFVMPLLLLDEMMGLATLLPYMLSAVSLALLFGFAARTGPPVPHYFVFFPMIIAPLAGIALFMASPAKSWGVASLSLLVCGIAWIRHRMAVRYGWEEPEPSDADAAEADQERLLKLRGKLLRKD
jgi:hypothetical protein